MYAEEGLHASLMLLPKTPNVAEQRHETRERAKAAGWQSVGKGPLKQAAAAAAKPRVAPVRVRCVAAQDGEDEVQ
jgi:hypothetical protein